MVVSFAMLPIHFFLSRARDTTNDTVESSSLFPCSLPTIRSNIQLAESSHAVVVVTLKLSLRHTLLFAALWILNVPAQLKEFDVKNEWAYTCRSRSIRFVLYDSQSDLVS